MLNPRSCYLKNPLISQFTFDLLGDLDLTFADDVERVSRGPLADDVGAFLKIILKEKRKKSH